MSAEQSLTEQSHEKPMMMHQMQHKHQPPAQGGSAGAVYGLGMIGAWIFYFKRATSFQEGLMGFLKGLVWPAFLVYDMLVFLKKE